MRCFLPAALGLLACAVFVGAKPAPATKAGAKPAPATKASAKPAPATKLEGRWYVVSITDSGKAMSAAVTTFMRIIFAKDHMKLVSPVAPEEARFSIDTAKRPGTLDLFFKNRRLLGIYELKGDELTICCSEREGVRSTRFASEPDSENDVLLVLKRDSLKRAR